MFVDNRLLKFDKVHSLSKLRHPLYRISIKPYHFFLQPGLLMNLYGLTWQRALATQNKKNYSRTVKWYTLFFLEHHSPLFNKFHLSTKVNDVFCRSWHLILMGRQKKTWLWSRTWSPWTNFWAASWLICFREEMSEAFIVCWYVVLCCLTFSPYHAILFSYLQTIFFFCLIARLCFDFILFFLRLSFIFP